MRKRACIGFLAMSLYVTLAATATYAQSNMRLVAHIPFDFQAGGKVLPAGDYSVTQITQGSSGVLVRSEDGDSAVIVLSNGTEAKANQSERARLDFHRYGDQYFLATVWGPERQGRSILESRRERSLRKEMRIAERAGLGPTKMQIVSVTARYIAD